MKETLKQGIAKILSKHYPYSYEDIYAELRKYNSIDLVINGIEDSLEYGISLEQADYYLKPNK